METLTVVAAIVAALAGGAVGWFVAQRRVAAQVEEARARADKAERAHQVVSQNAQQMRRQIDQLQRDTAALIARAAPTARARAAAAPGEPEAARTAAATDDAEARAERARAAEAALAALAESREGVPSGMQPTGFADTQPMEVPPR